jgi:hypothetical protein
MPNNLKKISDILPYQLDKIYNGATNYNEPWIRYILQSKINSM